jgi:PAS domain S-box-containing protein
MGSDKHINHPFEKVKSLPDYTELARLNKEDLLALAETMLEVIKNQDLFINHMADNSDYAFYAKDLNGKYLKVNDKFAKILNAPAHKIIGNTNYEFLDKAFSDTIRKDDEELIQTNSRQSQDDHIIDENGELRIYHTVKFVNYNLLGEPIGITGIIRDLTNEKKHEKSIKNTTAYLKAILNSSTESIWAVNEHFEIVFANEVIINDFKNVFGHNLNEGVNVISLLPEPFQQTWKNRYEQVLEGTSLEFTEKVPAKDHDYYIKVRMFPVVVDNIIKGVTGFSKNVTDEVLAQKELEQYYQTILKQNTILKDIAWKNSHVVRAPLSRIMGIINLLQFNNEEGNISDYNNNLFKAILSSAKELDEYIKQMILLTHEATIKSGG